jgi:hypothetical protein
LIPPANVKRAPVSGLPILIASGLATICEKPSPTVNKAVRKKGKLSIVAAGTNIKNQMQKVINQQIMSFLYQISKTSTLMIPRRK